MVLPALQSKALKGLLSVAQRRAALDKYITVFNQNVNNLASSLHSGGMGIDAWQLAMRAEMKDLHVSALILSHGGDRSLITFTEWGRLGGHIRVQYQYLHNYAESVQNNALGNVLGANKLYSEKYLAWRSKLYGGNSRASFYRGLTLGMLGQVPGDGKTICKTNCACELSFEEGDGPGIMFVTWELRPAEHCFPAGTMISTPSGSRPIENIQVGDSVQTLAGSKTVTRVYANPLTGRLCEVNAGSRSVKCTPNHPFLTQRGWIEAGEIRPGDMVFLEHSDQVLPRKVTFPYTDDDISTGGQVSILGSIATLLGLLPVSKRLESGMTMPIVSVGLDDKIANAYINDELGLDQERGLERYAEFGQQFAQFAFQAGRVFSFETLVAFKQALHNAFYFFRMGFSPFSNLALCAIGTHRIVLRHADTGSLIDDSSRSLFVDRETKPVRLASDRNMIAVKLQSHNLGSIDGVTLFDIGNLLCGPTPNSSRSFLRGKFQEAMQAVISLAIAVVSAVQTSFTSDTFPFSAVGDIATSNRAEPFLIVSAAPGRFANRVAAGFTEIIGIRGHGDMLPPDSDVPVLYPNTHKEQTVYNLEVEDVHHYIANGFVVHNCDDCLALSQAWNPLEVILPIPLAREWSTWLPRYVIYA